MPHHEHHHTDHGSPDHGHGHHKGHKHGRHEGNHAHDHGQHGFSFEPTARAQPMSSRPIGSEQPAPYTADAGCPKRGGTGECSGECRTCPNRLR